MSGAGSSGGNGMKTVVITGATSGIGFETAKLLAKRGFRIIGIGRSREHCAEAERKIAASVKNANTKFLTADLMNQREVNRAADELTEFINQSCGGELYALINNAGCARGYYMTTADGFEHQFALNYLAGFLLTYRLLPLLQKSSGRVIMTCSESHKGIKVHWNDVMLSERYNPLTAYKQSKLCDILFAKGLNDRYAKSGVRAYAVDPGLVNTDIGSKGSGSLVSFIWNLRKRGGVSPAVPAQTFEYLCTADPAPEGLYYRLSNVRTFSKQVTKDNASRLFELSEKLCGIHYMTEDEK